MRRADTPRWSPADLDRLPTGVITGSSLDALLRRVGRPAIFLVGGVLPVA